MKPRFRQFLGLGLLGIASSLPFKAPAQGASSSLNLVIIRDSPMDFGTSIRRAQYGKLYRVKAAGLNKAQISTQGMYVSETLELPSRQNMNNVSNIPPGTYQATSETHPKFGWVVRLKGTGTREGVLVHRGNYPIDTEGCILLGEGRASGPQPVQVPSAKDTSKTERRTETGVGPIVPMVTNSDRAMKAFQDLFEGLKTTTAEIRVLD
jgi:hypothetical protein